MLCPCGSSKHYPTCCKILHDGKAAHNALELMRSRYSAYALGQADYIIQTTHPASTQYTTDHTQWKNEILNFSKSTRFEKLEVFDFQESGSVATVTFTVHLLHGKEDSSFTEQSYFEKFHGKWLYRGGKIVQGKAPNLVTTGQFKVLPLAYFGDPILKKKAEPIQEITQDVKKLIEEMVDTMDACDGIGLAAPQVHHSIRLFIIRVPLEDKKGDLHFGDVKVFINPVLLEMSDASWTSEEGCLSIPTIRADVARSKEITIEYTNLSGKKQKEHFSGWGAKVIQHEYDHIEGILFTDRLTQEQLHTLLPLLNDLKNRIHNVKRL